MPSAKTGETDEAQPRINHFQEEPGLASYLTHLECAACGTIHTINERHSSCQVCGGPLFCRYGLCQAAGDTPTEKLDASIRNFWRWQCLLPVQSETFRLSIGEGDTPLVRLSNAGRRLGLDSLYLKDETANPTGSMEDRSFCTAVARARELGADTIALASTGNSGGCAAAYAAVHHLQAHVYMPKESLQSNRNEVVDFGGHLHLVDGSIENACSQASADSLSNGWYLCSSFHEPYRLEGMKTAGFELARSFKWTPPDWIVFPSQTGLGLTGIWKAFEEMHEMGWLHGPLPRLAAVRYRDGYHNPDTDIYLSERIVNGDRKKYSMPVGFAVEHNLKIIKESNGIPVSLQETELDEAQLSLSQEEGILFSLPGTAAMIGLQHLVSDGTIKPDQRIVVINTASGLKSF
jgi:threonine synthase